MEEQQTINLGDINLGENKEGLSKKFLLVDLDCLFDTRLPMTCLIDPEGMNRMLGLKQYNKRKKDVFGNIPEALFKRIYETRTKHILEAAKPTPMIEFIKELYADMAFDVSRLAYHFDVGIFINMYPYNFDDSELDSFKVLFNRIYKNITIEFVNKSISELTPSFVRKHIGTMIKYDILYWLEYHTAMLNIFQNHIFGIPLIAPMIGAGSVLKKDINQEYFKLVRKNNSKVAHLEFLPVYMYSYSDEPVDWKKNLKDDKS